MDRPITLVITILIASIAIGQAPPADDKGNNSTANAGSSAGSSPDSTVVDGTRVYKPGAGVTPPHPLKHPDPEYSVEARKRKIQGVCVLWLIVGADGLPRDIRVARVLGYGLDEKAIEAVKKWRFKPATKDGVPVAAMVKVEVSFRLW